MLDRCSAFGLPPSSVIWVLIWEVLYFSHDLLLLYELGNLLFNFSVTRDIVSGVIKQESL